LEIGGKIERSMPKTKAGECWVSLDGETVALLWEHRKRQAKDRLAAGSLWQGNDLIFCREDGSPLRPGFMVTKQFYRIAEAAGLSRIRLHDGRHTAASLALEAGVEMKVVSHQLGHSSTKITSDLYTHVRPAVSLDAAERVAEIIRLPETRQSDDLAGS
jgi:integrase